MREITIRSPIGEVVLPDTDVARSVYREVIETDCYGIGRLHAAGFRPTMVWDLGASWGVASVLLAHHWPEATVWAFEPVPDPFRFAVRNCQAFPNVRVFNRALVGFLDRDARATAEGIAYDGVWRASPQTCLEELAAFPCSSVSAFLAENPLPRPLDLLKVDIEGCEIGVLRELRQLGVLQGVAHVRGEWHFNAFHELPRLLAPSHHFRMTPGVPNPWHYFEAEKIAEDNVVSVWLEGWTGCGVSRRPAP
jgi:FkbM family methyltransferase